MTKKNFSIIILILIIAILATIAILFFQLKKINEITIEMAEKPLIDYHFTPIKTDTTDPLLGNPGAPLTIIEFLDLNSEESIKIHQKLTEFTRKHPQKIRLIVLDFPYIGFFASSNNLLPHFAARCVFEQEAKLFFDYVNELSKIKKHLAKKDTLESVAQTLNLNMPLWQTCMESEKTEKKISQSIEQGFAAGIRRAPEVFINHKRINYLTDIKIEDLLLEILKEYK